MDVALVDSKDGIVLEKATCPTLALSVATVTINPRIVYVSNKTGSRTATNSIPHEAIDPVYPLKHALLICRYR
jgi:hypothetical protein